MARVATSYPQSVLGTLAEADDFMTESDIKARAKKAAEAEAKQASGPNKKHKSPARPEVGLTIRVGKARPPVTPGREPSIEVFVRHRCYSSSSSLVVLGS